MKHLLRRISFSLICMMHGSCTTQTIHSISLNPKTALAHVVDTTLTTLKRACTPVTDLLPSETHQPYVMSLARYACTYIPPLLRPCVPNTPALHVAIDTVPFMCLNQRIALRRIIHTILVNRPAYPLQELWYALNPRCRTARHPLRERCVVYYAAASLLQPLLTSLCSTAGPSETTLRVTLSPEAAALIEQEEAEWQETVEHAYQQEPTPPTAPTAREKPLPAHYQDLVVTIPSYEKHRAIDAEFFPPAHTPARPADADFERFTTLYSACTTLSEALSSTGPHLGFAQAAFVHTVHTLGTVHPATNR